MLQSFTPTFTFLHRLADGTVKQVNPFTGTEVWTVPGRAHRPLGSINADPSPIDPAQHEKYCAFCPARVLETPPEKTRLVADDQGSAHIIRDIDPEDLTSPWEFRRIPNLFEILAYEYWFANYGHELQPAALRKRERYLSSSVGRAHVLEIIRTKLLASGTPIEVVNAMSETRLLEQSTGLFGSGHDVIVGRRHYVDGASNNQELASSGTLTPQEHEWYFRLTVDGMRNLYQQNRYARYVAVFQNWLRPAGASFDHLHKQLVAIDERGVQTEQELQKVRLNPNIFNEQAVDYAAYHNLTIAENDHAVAFAGFGHRYPTLEVFSKSESPEPWKHSAEELRGVSDLVHALHAASGSHIPTNEEWHTKPLDVDMPMPWRIMIKWRVSTLAGFEGGTKIYLNTIDPWNLRDRIVPALLDLRQKGKISPNLRIATECDCRPNSLRYNPNLR